MQNIRLYYENAAAELELGEYWRQYIAALAFELCGMETEVGDAFIKRKDLTTGDPLNILMEIAESSSEFFKRLKEKNITGLGKSVWNAQIRICLPMIEIERCGYITAQHGLLHGIMSSEYWDESSGQYKVLFKPQEEGEAGDPYEMDLSMLNKLAYLKKKLVILGTVSYAQFFRMNVNDRDRISLIADLQDRLTHFRICSTEELEKLFGGHEKFLER